MAKVITLKKGLDIPLQGAPVREDGAGMTLVAPATVAITPDDFPGLVPRLDVKEGDTVNVGDVVFHDKVYTDIKVVSPVGGVVSAIVRGERRKILRVVLTPSSECATASRVVEAASDAVLAERILLDAGLWPYMRQRPYGTVPVPGVRPRDIIISGFDSAPLAPDYEPLAALNIKELNVAVALLKKLTSGSVFLTMRSGSSLEKVEGCDSYIVNGPHPAGNPGVQLANIKPVNKGDIVWTIDLPTAVRIGKYVSRGILDFTTEVAVTGCEIKSPGYINTVVGANLATLLNDRQVNDGVHHRIIAGNVLTGIAESESGYLRFPYTQVTVIPEGDDVNEFMGWASLSPEKMSVNRSFPGILLRKKLFCADARLLGGRRAMIMSGVYDKVLPMDIMVEYLIKACLAKNIERMEQLGIYEVVPEDIALCEYVDPSKIELQSILREALDYAYKELN